MTTCPPIGPAGSTERKDWLMTITSQLTHWVEIDRPYLDKLNPTERIDWFEHRVRLVLITPIERIIKTVQDLTASPENEPETSNQPSLAPSVRHDTCQTRPDLALVIDAWDRLSEAVRAGIVAMVKAASKGDPGR